MQIEIWNIALYSAPSKKVHFVILIKSFTTTIDMYLQRWQCNLQHKLNGYRVKALLLVLWPLVCSVQLCVAIRMTLQFVMQRTAHVNLSCLYRDVAYTLWCMCQAFNCVSIFFAMNHFILLIGLSWILGEESIHTYTTAKINCLLYQHSVSCELQYNNGG